MKEYLLRQELREVNEKIRDINDQLINLRSSLANLELFIMCIVAAAMFKFLDIPVRDLRDGWSTIMPGLLKVAVIVAGFILIMLGLTLVCSWLYRKIRSRRSA
jgi:hypothetical protein